MKFGIAPKTHKSIAWGARALYTSTYSRFTGKFERSGMYVFELLWDRQQFTGGTDEERKVFEKWINKKGLPALRKLVKKESIDTSSSMELTLELDGYRIVASPKASHGYLYIGIFPIADGECIEAPELGGDEEGST